MIDLNSLEQQNGLPPGTLAAMMQRESGGNPNAVSPKGAIGAFQFMPQTAQQYGIDPTNPDQSAQAAAQMMGQLRQKYNGDMPSALAGYNWGQGNVDRQGLQNAPPETQNYIQNIMGKIGSAIVPPAEAAEVQPAVFDVKMPDGTVIKNVPQGTTKDQLQAKLSNSQNTPGIFDTMTNSAKSAATFGLAGPVSGLGGGLASLMKGGSFGEGYDQGKQQFNSDLEAGSKANPIASSIGTAAGIVGGAPAATAKAGMEAAGATGSTLMQGAKARDAEALADSTLDLKQAANPSYQAVRDSGEVLAPEDAADLAQNVEKSISATGLNNARLHGDTLSVLDDFKSAAANGDLSVEGVDQYRQLFRDVIEKNTDAIRGMNPDAFKAQQAIRAIDTGLDGLKESYPSIAELQAGRSQAATANRFQSVANVIKQAGGDPNRLKAGLQRFVNKDSNLRGFSMDEVAALRAAATNTTTEKLLKMAGKFGIDLGSSLTPGNTALPAISAFVGGAAAAPIVAGGTLARQAQKYLARGKAEKALQLIKGRK